jgi:hypothetical protein
MLKVHLRHFIKTLCLTFIHDISSKQAEELKRTCNDFLHHVSEFKQIADSFIEIFDAVSAEVEKEKIGSIGAQNLLQTSAKHREAQVQQLTSLVQMIQRLLAL